VNPTPKTKPLAASLADFAWSSWAELGVPGWERKHREWCIDPEALMLLTESIGESDPRLLDEANRWCAEHRALLSRSRWTQLRSSWPVTIDTPRVDALETVKAASSGAAQRISRSAGKRSSRTAATPSRAGWLALRLRSAFGPTARAELVRILLLELVSEAATAADFALEAGCTKRNAADAFEMLGDAGVVDASSHGNRLHFELRNRDALETVFGPLPKSKLTFASAARVLVAMVKMERELADLDPTVRSIEARGSLSKLTADLRRIDRPAPRIAAGSDAWGPWLAWARETVACLAGSKAR
jgi:hypothetical protein